MKKLIPGICAFGLGAVAFAATTSHSTIGAVDVHAVLSQIPQVKKINTELQSKFKPREEALKKQQDTLQANMKKYGREKSVASKEDLKKLAGTISTEQKDFMQQQQSLQSDLMNAQQTAMQDLLKDIQNAVKAVAQKDGYTVVMQKESLPYIADNMDITQAVVKQLEA